MQLSLSSEMFWLVLTCLMTGLMWVPYILNRMYEQSPLPALWNPMPDQRPRAKWAERMMRAHENAVENLVVFAPLVIAVEILNVANESTAMACMVYFLARAGHFLVFSFGIPLLRVILFMLNVIAQVYLAVHLLSGPVMNG